MNKYLRIVTYGFLALSSATAHARPTDANPHIVQKTRTPEVAIPLDSEIIGQIKDTVKGSPGACAKFSNLIETALTLNQSSHAAQESVLLAAPAAQSLMQAFDELCAKENQAPSDSRAPDLTIEFEQEGDFFCPVEVPTLPGSPHLNSSPGAGATTRSQPGLLNARANVAQQGADKSPPQNGITTTFVPPARAKECQNRFENLEACRRDHPTWTECVILPDPAKGGIGTIDRGLCPPSGSSERDDPRCNLKGCQRQVTCTNFDEGSGEWKKKSFTGPDGFKNCLEWMTKINNVCGMGLDDTFVPGPGIPGLGRARGIIASKVAIGSGKKFRFIGKLCGKAVDETCNELAEETVGDIIDDGKDKGAPPGIRTDNPWTSK